MAETAKEVTKGAHTIKDIIGDTVKHVKDDVNKIKDVEKSVADAVEKDVKRVADKVKDSVIEGVSKAKEIEKSVVNAVEKDVKIVGDKVKDSIKKGEEEARKLKDKVADAGKHLDKVVDNVKDNVKDSVVEGVSKAKEIEKSVDAIGNKDNGSNKNVGEGPHDIDKTKIMEQLKEYLKKGSEALVGLKNKITDFVHNVKDSEFFKNLQSKLESLYTSITQSLKRLFESKKQQ